MANKDKIIENLSELGIDVDDEVAEKCVQLCIRYGIEESELVDTWVAFSVTNGDMQLSIESISLMEKNELSKSNVTPISSKKESRMNFDSAETTFLPDNSFNYEPSNIEDYEDVAQVESDRRRASVQVKTPKSSHPYLREENVSRRIAVHSPRSLFSPVSFSPVAIAPSKKYSERTNAGEVVCRFEPNKACDVWETKTFAPQQLDFADDFSHIPSDARYMFQTVATWILDSKKLADTICIDIIEKNDLKFPIEIHHISTETATYAGRIKCDSNGKLNTSSILLESCLFSQRGDSVQLQVTDLLEYSLFPGQIVVIEGKNPTGTKIIAEKLFTDVQLPLCPVIPTEFLEPREPLHIVVSAGPYTLSDTLSYQPWQDLCDYVIKHKPHVLILLGPIVDVSHQGVEDNSMNEPFLLFFERQLAHLLDCLQDPKNKVHTKVVNVSSWRDASVLNVFPTPSVHTRLDRPNLFLAPDPCMLNINGFHVGATSTDILMHLGKQELFCSATGPATDRLGRLASHLLLQKTFYPLMPPAEEIGVDLNLLLEHGMLPYIPHMMILPSELKHFVKDIKGCIVVNPERLAKGLVGGSFARVEVASAVDGKQWSPASHVSVQIVKI